MSHGSITQQSMDDAERVISMDDAERVMSICDSQNESREYVTHGTSHVNVECVV